MTGESQLNVYIVGARLPPRLRQRLQAQLRTALRSLPEWPFDLLRRRLQALGASNFPLVVEPRGATHFPLVVEPRGADDSSERALSLGDIEGRPAAYLLPRLRGDSIDWRQDLRYLLAKAIAFLAAPPAGQDPRFWRDWAAAVEADGLRDKAARAGEAWQSAGDLDLLLEMFAALALTPDHERWSALPAVRAFFEAWRQEAA